MDKVAEVLREEPRSVSVGQSLREADAKHVPPFVDCHRDDILRTRVAGVPGDGVITPRRLRALVLVLSDSTAVLLSIIFSLALANASRVALLEVYRPMDLEVWRQIGAMYLGGVV